MLLKFLKKSSSQTQNKHRSHIIFFNSIDHICCFNFVPFLSKTLQSHPSHTWIILTISVVGALQQHLLIYIIILIYPQYDTSLRL